MLMLRRVLMVLVGVLVGALGFGGAPALAAHVFSGSFGEAGAGAGQFSGPSGVAVNEETGDVYVVDKGNNRVQEFNASGSAVLGEFNGVAAGHPLSGPEGIAVDNSTNPLDPSRGDVYVADAGHHAVDRFSTSGVFEGQLTLAKGAAGGGEEKLEGLGVDPAGTVWVYQDNATGRGEVQSYGDALGNPFLLSRVHEGEGAGAGFAVDSEDNLYVNNFFRIFEKTDSGGNTLIAKVDAEEATGAAVDESNDDVYIDNIGTVAEFGPSGSELDRFGAGKLTAGSGVAVNSATATVYVADSTTDSVSLFVAPVPPGVATGEASSTVVEGSGTLTGVVNPRGVQVTSCEFEYVSDAALRELTGMDFEELVKALPAGEILAVLGVHAACEHPGAGEISGSGAVAVHAGVSGLTPGVVYHVGLLAGNGDGSEPAFGGARAFFASSRPVLGGESASDVVSGSAVLHAQVDPEGLASTYRFEYGTSTGYGASVPVPDGALAAGTDGVFVSARLSGLSANTTYHWRIVASNAFGVVRGVDHTFIYDTTGAGLPDNRAYEMVTPPRKNGAAIDTGVFIKLPGISEDGSRVVDFSIQCFAGSVSCTGDRRGTEGEPFAFTRTGGGWVTTPLAPPATQFRGNMYRAFSADTGAVLFEVPTGPFGEEALYVRKPDGSFSAVSPTLPYEPVALGTADFSHVVVYTPNSLTNPVYLSDLVYEYVGGNAQPVLVGVSGGLGSTDLISACETGLAGAFAGAPGTLSANGDVVFFTAEKCASGSGVNTGVPVPAQELYARIDESRSVLLSGRSPLDCTSAACTSSPPSDAEFSGASADGSRAFFLSTQQLTDSASEDSGDSAIGGGACASTVGVGGCNLYEYDFSSPAGHNLVAASAGDSSGGGPRVQGVVAISADGSHVYFVAKGVLTGVANSQGQLARDGAENLYVFERDTTYPAGRVAFVATLSGENSVGIGVAGSDAQQWLEAPLVANVTPDGRFLVFTSRERLTADDTSTTGAAQVFRYDAQTGELVRISIGDRGFNDNGNANMRNAAIAQPRLGAASGSVPRRSDPTMSNDGSFVFFESAVGLTSGALNEMPIGGGSDAGNVYEWHEGHVYLISDGRDTAHFSGNNNLLETGGGSAVDLLGSDGSGANVFFTTADSLVAQDTDSGLDIYDARICTVSEPCVPSAPAQVAGCEGEACHGTPAGAPVFGAPGSAVFSGAGNLTQPAAKPAVKAKAKKKKRGAKPRKKARRTQSAHGRKGKGGAARSGGHVKRRRG
jgi:DNA-binding beta-propeller fold protein YncE